MKQKMKKLLKLIIVLFTFSHLSTAQSTEQYKKDSAALAQQKIILTIQNEILSLQKKSADDAKSDKATDFKNEVDKIKAYKEILGGDTPTALSGDITIAKGDAQMAETRVLIYQNLETLVNKFIVEKYSTAINNETIIIYSPTHYQSIPYYHSLLKELDNLKSNYVGIDNKIPSTDPVISVVKLWSDKSQGTEVLDILNPVTLGIGIIKELIDLSTLFKAETKFLVNDEAITEEQIVSKIVDLDNKGNQYYYPSSVPFLNAQSSSLLNKLKEVETAQENLASKLTTYVDKIKALYQPNIQSYELKKKSLEEKLKLAKETKNEKKIADAQAALDNCINNELNPEKTKQEIQIKDFLKPYNTPKIALDSTFNTIKRNLIAQPSEDGKPSLLNVFILAENLIAKLNNNAYTLKVTARGTGTNKIKKFLWGTTLKHSASTEINFQLYNKDGMLKKASSNILYHPFIKSKEITTSN